MHLCIEQLLKLHFNSLPHAEVDGEKERRYSRWKNISTHYLTQRQTQNNNMLQDRRRFQLTTSRRGRLQLISSSYCFSTFQLTTSRRGRRFKRCDTVFSHRVFQLTTSRRGRPSAPSRQYPAQSISTHYLTQRQTIHQRIRQQRILFQLTTSRRGRQTAKNIESTVSKFQLTTSRRGRPHTGVHHGAQQNFNSLPHAEVDQARNVDNLIMLVFQLTTSRRGRLNR